MERHEMRAKSFGIQKQPILISFSPSSPSGEPNIPGSISISSPQLKSVLNQSEPKPLKLADVFADVVDAQPHEQLTEQSTRNIGQINKQLNGGCGGSSSSRSTAIAMDESTATEDDKSGIKRKENNLTRETPVTAQAKAKGMSNQTPDNKAQLRTIINKSPQQLTGKAIQSLTVNDHGFDITTAIENYVSKGKLDAVQGMQLEKEYEKLMAELAAEGGYADMKSDVAGKKHQNHQKEENEQ